MKKTVTAITAVITREILTLRTRRLKKVSRRLPLRDLRLFFSGFLRFLGTVHLDGTNSTGATVTFA